MREPVDYARFRREHLNGVVACAKTLEWPSYADTSTALAAFTAPGAVSWVALDGQRVIGLSHLLTNGVVHAHLSLVGVLPEHRRRGIARRLIAEAFAQSGAKWLDLCSEPGSEGFYRSFRHESAAGFRLYPSAAR
jgi:ribosomal protein S18 acetylase RimI-like enzyme